MMDLNQQSTMNVSVLVCWMLQYDPELVEQCCLTMSLCLVLGYKCLNDIIYFLD